MEQRPRVARSHSPTTDDPLLSHVNIQMDDNEFIPPPCVTFVRHPFYYILPIVFVAIVFLAITCYPKIKPQIPHKTLSYAQKQANIQAMTSGIFLSLFGTWHLNNKGYPQQKDWTRSTFYVSNVIRPLSLSLPQLPTKNTHSHPPLRVVNPTFPRQCFGMKHFKSMK